MSHAAILVVDDHAANRELVVSLIEHLGHRALKAADGAEGLAIVRAQRPALVISDILMPTMDGYELVRQMRDDPAIAATPVIFHTAHYREREAQQLARDCGVLRVVTKPFEPQEMLDAIQEALGLQAPRAAPAIAEAFDREHLRLLTDKLSEKVRDLEASNQRLGALTSVSLQLASEHDPAALLASVCREARALVSARHALLCVINKHNGGAPFFTQTGQGVDIPAPPSEAGIFQRVMAQRRTVRAGPGSRDALDELPAGFASAQSMITAPVVSLTAAYGWLCVLDKVGLAEFTQEDERILTALAAQVGRIYENGSLYRAVREHAENLKAEVAEHRRTAEELRESELRFRQIAENIREVFYLAAADGSEMLYVSPGYEEIWGQDRESLLRKPLSWQASIHLADLERIRAQPKEPAGGFEYHYRIIRPDASVRHIHDRGFPIRNEAGAVYRIAGLAEDVTEAVQMREDLRERERGLRHAQVLARFAHVITGMDGVFERWSDTLPDLIATPPSAMPRYIRQWLALVHPDDRELFRGQVIEAGRGAKPVELEYRMRRGDGEWIHMRHAVEPMNPSGDGRGFQWFSTMQDVTLQKRMEEERRESDRRFSDMLAKVELISMMLDRDARVTYCNDFLLRLTGWKREEVIGRDWFELFVPREAKGVRQVFADLLADNPASWHHENPILTRSGEQRLVNWNNSVLRSHAGEIIGTASLGEDITERKRAEEEVRRLNEDLERRVDERTAELEVANQELQAFDYSISHDLRAPLNHMRGFSIALLEDHGAALDETGRSYLVRIAAGAAQMDDLVGDLLSLSTVSRGTLNRVDTRVGRIADGVVEELRRSDPQREVEWAVRCDKSMHVDAGLLRIALQNLLGNAWKFTGRTPGARIELGCESREGEATVFWVRDNGAGFDPAEAHRLFAPFQRLHAKSEFPGTGIGLATVQRIVRRHGGRIWAEGENGKGATFYFTLAD